MLGVVVYNPVKAVLPGELSNKGFKYLQTGCMLVWIPYKMAYQQSHGVEMGFVQFVHLSHVYPREMGRASILEGFGPVELVGVGVEVDFLCDAKCDGSLVMLEQIVHWV